MSIYFPEVAVNLKRLLPDEVAIKLQEYKSAETAYSSDMKRCVRNLRAFTGLGDDQWPESVAKAIKREGRETNTYNFLQMYAEGAAGNFLMNWIDPKWVDNESDSKNTEEAIIGLQRAWFADKEHFDYKQADVESTVNGCIYGSCEELEIVRGYSDPRGRLKFTSLRPDMIIPDQGNYTDNLTRNQKRAHKRFYMSAADLVRFYPHMESEIRQKLDDRKNGNQSIGMTWESVAPATSQPQGKIGSQLLVIEDYHIEYDSKTIALEVTTQKILPETQFEFGSEEDFFAKAAWFEMNCGCQLSPANIKVIRKSLPTLYVTTICEQLGLLIENRKDERQLLDEDGQLHFPFYWWAYVQKNGKMMGLVDIGYDAQFDINAREAHKTKLFTQSMITSKPIIHPMAFGDKNDRRAEEIANMNDPTKPFILDENSPPGLDLVKWIGGGNIPQSLFIEEDKKIEFMSRMLRLPPAMQGMPGKSGQSGVLFGRMVIEGNIMQMVPATTLQMKQNYKAEDWTRLAILKYGGETESERVANYNREFRSKEFGKLTVNRYMGDDENGNPIVEADISKLKRVDVIISQTKESDYMKQAKREMTAEGLKSIPPTQTNALTRAILENSFVMSQDFYDEDERELAKLATEKNYKLNDLMMDVQIKNLEAQMAPPAPPPAPEQGGMPPQGGEAMGGAPAMPVPQGASPAPQPMGPPQV